MHVPIHLRWGDLDAFNHVNNATMLKLLEEARVRVFWSPIVGEEAPDTAVIEAGLDARELTLIARQEIEYLAPVPYRGRVCEPAYVADTAAFVAGLRGTDVEHLKQVTTANFFNLFSKAQA